MIKRFKFGQVVRILPGRDGSGPMGTVSERRPNTIGVLMDWEHHDGVLVAWMGSIKGEVDRDWFDGSDLAPA